MSMISKDGVLHLIILSVIRLKRTKVPPTNR